MWVHKPYFLKYVNIENSYVLSNCAILLKTCWNKRTNTMQKFNNFFDSKKLGMSTAGFIQLAVASM